MPEFDYSSITDSAAPFDELIQPAAGAMSYDFSTAKRLMPDSFFHILLPELDLFALAIDDVPIAIDESS